jgi:hypothetical protein
MLAATARKVLLTAVFVEWVDVESWPDHSGDYSHFLLSDGAHQDVWCPPFVIQVAVAFVQIFPGCNSDKGCDVTVQLELEFPQFSERAILSVEDLWKLQK